MSQKQPKSLYTYESDTYREHGYTHTRFIVSRDVEKVAIADQITRAAQPDYYSDPSVAARMAAHYSVLRDQGATHVYETPLYGDRLVFTFLHCEHSDGSIGYSMRVEFPDSVDRIDGAYRMWQAIRARLNRTLGRAASLTYGFQHGVTPDALERTLDAMRGERIAAVKTAADSAWTLVAPHTLPLRENWSLV